MVLVLLVSCVILNYLYAVCESSGGKRPTYRDPKKRKIIPEIANLVGFKGISFQYEQEFGKVIEHTILSIPNKSHHWFNITISRPDNLHIIERGLDFEWNLNIRHLTGKPVTLRHNHYRKANIFSSVVQYASSINTISLFTRKQMVYQNQITISDGIYSSTVHIWFRISLIDPLIDKLELKLLSDTNDATIIPRPFKFCLFILSVTI